jgi:hypothetical protein
MTLRAAGLFLLDSYFALAVASVAAWGLVALAWGLLELRVDRRIHR